MTALDPLPPEFDFIPDDAARPAGWRRRIQHAFSAARRQDLSMHHALALLLAVSAVAVIATGAAGTLAEEKPAPVAAPTQGPAHPQSCLSSADMREAVAEKRVIAPLAAISAARKAYPRAEIQRASLCQHEGALVYVLTTLRREGQFVQVVVDAQSGQVRQ